MNAEIDHNTMGILRSETEVSSGVSSQVTLGRGLTHEQLYFDIISWQSSATQVKLLAFIFPK